MPEEVNPFAAPQTAPEPYIGDREIDDEAEVTRRKYLKHEASVKSIGFLYYLGSIFGAIFMGMAAFGWLQNGMGLVELIILGVFLVMTLVGFLAGYWLRRLDRRARPIVGVMATLGLLQIPVGTLINAYILWLIFSEKGKIVFSNDYREVIAKTPHIKYRSSTIMIILVVVVVALLVAGIVSWLFIG